MSSKVKFKCVTLTYYRNYQQVANFVVTLLRRCSIRTAGSSPELARKLLRK